MLITAVVWKRQAWKHWLFRSGVYSTGLETSLRGLISSGANENCGGATWRNVLVGLVPLEPQKMTPAVSQSDRGICCRPRWGLRKAGGAQEKRYSVDEACPRMATLSYLWPYEWPRAVCAPSGWCLAVGRAMTPAGRTPELASPEPDTGVQFINVFKKPCSTLASFLLISPAPRPSSLTFLVHWSAIGSLRLWRHRSKYMVRFLSK